MPDRFPHDEFAPLERLFEAQSIAVIGASFNLDKIGGKPIRYLQTAGYQGAIHPVNPRYEAIANLPCYPNIAAIDSPIDVAIIVVPSHAVDTAIDDCVAAEVPFALIFSAGFGELGEEGRRRQADLVAKARAGGLRLVGPNSLGIASSSNSLIASFASLFDRHKQLKPGRIGFISQSGAVGAFIYGIAEDDGFGFSRFVSVGNEADLDVADFMAYMANDPSTSAIGGYLEGVNDGRRFLAAADLVRRAGKPMSFMKVGQSEAGQRAAASHTGSIAGTDAIYDAAFRQAGIIRASDPQGLLDFLQFHASPEVRPARPGVAVLTVSGGCGVWCADRLSTLGLDLAEFTPETTRRLTDVLPPFASPQNPVDATGQIQNDPTMFEDCLSTLLDDPGVGTLVIALGLQELQGEAMAQQIVAAQKLAPDKCVVVAWLAGPEIVHTVLRAAGIPIFGDLARAVDLVGAAVQAHHVAAAPIPVKSFAPTASSIGALPLTEHEAKQFLAKHGIPIPHGRLCQTFDEALAAVNKIGYPVAAKGQVSGLAHKTEHGLVRLDIGSDAALRSVYDDLEQALATVGSSDDVVGILVEEMAPAGLDVIVGTLVDDVFGPTVMFGLGGVLVEIVDDVAFRVCPVTDAEAAEMIDSTRASRLLNGYRGGEPLDRDALATVISRLSQLAMTERSTIGEIEINPLRVTPDGVLALDALFADRGTA